MCGIAGILSREGRPVGVDEIHAMCAVMQHRGPDDEGIVLGSGVGLGMRRLSIIDVDNGHQPIANEDRTVWVVLNGEIYNFGALRQHLELRGHRFATRTDTETLVHLYEEYGPDLVRHLRGMFTFALWDERRRRLLLARDRLGIKPLYYAEVGDRFVFASELKAILQIEGVERRLDWHAVDHLFTSLTTPPDRSIIEHVRKLEPAHTLTVSSRTVPRLERYWDLSLEPDYDTTPDELAEEIRATLAESVRLHMISDVPTGAFLSGGIDSSAVVALMAGYTTAPLRTFSIGFKEAAFDERPHARVVAGAFGTDHHELLVEPDAIDVLDDLVWHLDEPFGDSSAIPTYMVSKLAAEHVTVALSGDGGDELFGGYDKYRVEARERSLDDLPAPVRRLLARVGDALPDRVPGKRFLRHRALTGWERYLDASTLFDTKAKRRLFQPDVLRSFAARHPWTDAFHLLSQTDGAWLSAAGYLDLRTYLPLDILTKVDRMSMAHALEVRVPLLDHPFVELAARIPAEFKLRNGYGKHIFKRALRGVLPDSTLHRRKQGFAVPLGGWFRGRLDAILRDLLLSSTSRARDIFDHRYVTRLIELHKQGRPLDLQLWTLISFELWCRLFLDGGCWARDPRPPARAIRGRHSIEQATAPALATS